MGKQGTKPDFTAVYFPNQDCKLYGITGKRILVSSGTYQI